MFSVEGRVRETGRSARVVWRAPATASLQRGLDGAIEVINLALRDEADGRTFRATPTGPFYRANLDDPVAALVQLTSYFQPGYVLGGDPPTVPVDPLPEGAIP